MAKNTRPTRTKKIPEIKEPDEELGFEDAPEEFFEEEEVPIATEHHTVVRKYITQVPVIPPEIEAAAAQPDPESLPPLIAQLLAEASGAIDEFQWDVYRVPNYKLNGRSDSRSRDLCGRLPFTTDFEFETQRHYARPGLPNHFLLILKRKGAYVPGGTLPVFSCDPAPLSEQINFAPQPIVASAPAHPQLAPHVSYVIEPPNQPAPQVAQPNAMEQLKQSLAMLKLMRDTFDPSPQPAPPPVAAADPETTFLQVLAKDTDIVGKLAKGTLGKLLGDGVAADRDPWADVAMEAIKSGQGAQILSSAIDAIFRGMSGMGRTAAQPQTINTAPAVEIAPPIPGAPATIAPAAQPAVELSPEMQVLSLALDHCAQNLPPQIAAQRITAIADQINEQAPAFSIDGYLDLFASMDTAAALEMAQTLLPERADIASLPHAVGWTAQLQVLLKSEEGESDGTD